MKALTLALALPLAACFVGGNDTVGGGGDAGVGGTDGGGSGSATRISGTISADATWSGNIEITAATTIATGVTVTVSPGTAIAMDSSSSLTVQGTFNAPGTSAGKITIGPATSGGYFGGVLISSGGVLAYNYVAQSGGGIQTSGTAKATIIDSHMSMSQGDYLVMNGGTVDVEYSWLGLAAGMTNTTHCEMHFGGAGVGNVIKVTHTNVSTSSYGLMFYNGSSADFTYNNWFSNTYDVDTSGAGAPVSGDFSNGYFEKGAPSGTGIVANTPSSTKLATCDGTNNSTCAGMRP